MSSFVIDPHEYCKPCAVCTFSITGTNLLHQAIYVCNTCDNGSVGACCCSGCASVCHASHNTSFLAFGRAFCDCGESGCKLLNSSLDQARYVLGEKSCIPETMSDVIHEFKQYALNGEEQIYSLLIQEATIIAAESNNTYWIGLNDSPRCALEGFAKQILIQHSHRFNDNESFGGEWWVQVKNAEAGIDLHYDKDEEIAEMFSVGLFPSLSTVTYLSGGKLSETQFPTVIFENEINVPVGQRIPRFYISWPVRGKHVAFDGRLLHGAPSSNVLRSLKRYIAAEDQTQEELAQTQVQSEKELRVTFLLNLWHISMRPARVNPLPEELVLRLSGDAPSGETAWSMEAVEMMPDLLVPQVIITNEPAEKETSQDSPGVVGDADDDEWEDASTASSESRIDTSNSSAIAVDPLDRIRVEGVAGGGHRGGWEMLPFVSDDSAWGRDETEAALRLRMWVPSPSELTNMLGPDLEVGWSTLILEYEGDVRCATLQYDTDEDAS